MPRLLALALLLPAVSLAQDNTALNAHGFDHVVGDNDVRDFLQTWRPETQVPGSLGFSLLAEYAESPLVLIQRQAGENTRLPLLDDVFAINAGVHFAVHERVALAAGMPLFLSSRQVETTDGPGIGDLHFSAPVGIVLPKEDDQGFGLSIIPTAYFPTGATDHFVGGGFAGGLTLAPAFGAGPFTFAGNAGVELGRSSDFQQLEHTPRLVTALGVTWAVKDTLGIGLEADFRSALAKNEVSGTNSPGEGVLHVKGRYPVGLSWTLGGAAGINRGGSAAKFRVFAGLGFTLGKRGARDLDGDGLVEADQCPREAEVFNNYMDDDGCPDALADLSVTIVDPEGALIVGAIVMQGEQELGTTNDSGQLMVQGLMPGAPLTIRSEHGSGFYVAAERDTEALESGANDLRINMLWAPGTIRVKTLTTEGGPVDSSLKFEGPEVWSDILVGADGEEMMVLPPGDWTIFAVAPEYGRERREVSLSPSENVLTVIEFGLSAATTLVTDSGVVILEPVLFDFDSSALKPRSRQLLTSVANDLRTTPEIGLVEVQGHTSTTGSSTYNRDLSQRRMDTVVQFLTGEGVEAGLLLPVGYGESCTAVVERGEEDRQKNRRVQFFILEPEPADGVPCHAGQPGQLDTARFEFSRERVETATPE
jgi:outer membrane protein OmpA-like peptidoglycan-associated protein